MSATSSRPSRASLSPFRSRKSSAPTPISTKPPLRPVTPSSYTSSRASHKPSVPPTISSVTPSLSANDRPDVSSKSKENVTVTVRFRPLSARELNKGDEVAWYADGDYTVRNEYNSSIAYGFDRVFGPATTTRHVYDVAAQHVVSGAMEGINGTVFAYGVTSSGKTHTMHGEQKSPGIVPLAVKDVFSIIQDTPDREFLLRISYLEIYNEVINDLLDPTGQNLRIREDPQGTYVEGIKEEVVLSPAHALSLIASGEAHRHVGSNNVNLLSSRSHTIFTLTIESSPRGEDHKEEDVTLSQMHLIDLAGSESSKTETTGLRRKEGSYINKSLLTLGTVISKLTDVKATHIPYRDSKLTRLLQSSLGGHGRISLICTVTPASSNSEETHNTLKFANRSKHVEIKASQNKIMDEKSLIKKYQKEISTLKEELQQLKRRMMGNPDIAVASEEDLVNLKLQLEAGQIKLQSRLEEEEQAKAALMGRIQRLTKLILVSTKHSIPSSIPEKLGYRRRHSFGEDELVYLPDKKRDYTVEDDAGSYASELSVEGNDDVTNLEELVKDYKRSKRRGMLGWFKMRKPDGQAGLSVNGDGESSASGSPGSCSKSTLNRFTVNDVKDGRRRSVSKRNDGSVVDSFPGTTQAGDLFSANKGGHRLTRTGSTIVDQMDLLREQVKILAEEVALSSSSLKRLFERAANDPENSELREEMRKIKDEISQKKHQMHILEQHMIGSFEGNSHASNNDEILQALSKLTTELNQKTFDLEIKSADNRILQEQLQLKISENTEMEETILLLRQQLNSSDKQTTSLSKLNDEMSLKLNDDIGSCPEVDKHSIASIQHVDKILSQEDLKHDVSDSQMDKQPFQMAEIENLNQEKVRLIREKDGLEIQCRKLAEEASYAKELAAAAAVELRNLAEEVTRLSYENAKISSDLAAAKEACSRLYNCRSVSYEHSQKLDDGIDRLQNELSSRFRREAALEATIAERDKVETELRIRLNEARHREEELENELDDMWALVSQMKRSGTNVEKPVIHVSSDRWTGNGNRFPPSNGRSYNLNSGNNGDTERMITKEELNVGYEKEQRKYREIQSLISTLQGEDIADLHAINLGRATKPSY